MFVFVFLSAADLNRNKFTRSYQQNLQMQNKHGFLTSLEALIIQSSNVYKQLLLESTTLCCYYSSTISWIFFSKTKLGCQKKYGEVERPVWPRRGGVLEEGAENPPQLGGLRERCMLLQRGPGRSHGRQIDVLHFKSSTWPLLGNEKCIMWMPTVVHTLLNGHHPFIIEV